MRCPPIIFVVLSLSALCVPAAEKPSEEKTIELCQNGDFSQGSPEEGPAHWSPRPKPPEGVKYYLSEDNSHSGPYCAVIESAYTDERPYFWWRQKIAVEPGRKYHLKGWIRSEDIQRDFVFGLSFVGDDGKTLRRAYIKNVEKFGSDWTEVSKTFKAPNKATACFLQVSLHGSGKVFVDDVSLVGPPPKDTPKADKAEAKPRAKAPAPLTEYLGGTLPRVERVDLVRNGDFSKGSLKWGPHEWTPKRIGPDDHVEFYLTDDNPHSGRRCVVIDSAHTEERPYYWWRQRVDLRGGLDYEFSAWVRSEDLQRDAVAALTYLNADNKQVGRDYIKDLQQHGSQWTRVSKAVTPPPRTVACLVQISMHGSGKVFVDDVSLLAPIESAKVDLEDALVAPVTRTDGSMAIDGQADEWRDVPRARVLHAYDVTQAEAIYIEKNESRGAADLSFAFALKHDPKNLYLLIEVRDDVRFTNPSYFMGDSIQMGFDTAFERSVRGFGPRDYAIGLAIEGDKVTPKFDHLPNGATIEESDIRGALADRPDGYTIEAAIPWRALGMEPPGVSHVFGFSIAVNDSDGKGRTWAEWSGGIVKGKNPSQYGKALVMGRRPIAVTIATPPEGVADIEPFAFDTQVISLSPEAHEETLTLEVRDEDRVETDKQRITVTQGMTVVPMVFETGSVSPGRRPVALTLGDLTFHDTIDVLPVSETIAETRDRLKALREAAGELTRLVKQGRAAGVDMALPDATLVTAEQFLQWIPADSARRGHETLALYEAKKLAPLIDAAVAEAKAILADDPARHPVRPTPNAMEAELRGANWFIGDRPVFLIGMFRYEGDVAELRRFGCNFAEAEGGGPTRFFNTKGETNLDQLTKNAIPTIEQAARAGVRCALRFNQRIPRWLIDEHPEIRDASGHFIYYDIDNPYAREIVLRSLRLSGEQMNDAPGATTMDYWNEANYHSVSDLGQAKFRAAMREKYGTIDRLNETWGADFKSFDEVKITRRDPADVAPYLDWSRWNAARVTDWIAEMNKAYKAAAPNILSCVKFPNEMMVEGSVNKNFTEVQTSRHFQGIDRYATARILDAQGCDTRPTMLTPDYGFAWRYPGLCYDLQRSMAPDKPIFDGEWHGVQTVYYQNADQPGAYLDAALWFSYMHGLDMQHIWWWGREGTEPKHRWFENSFVTQPQLVNAFARNSVTVQRLGREIVAFQEAKPRVRLFFSKTCAIVDLDHLDAERDVYETINWLNVPVGFVTEEMLRGDPGAPPGDCDLLIVPDVKYTANGVREALAARAKKGTRVLFVGDQCLSMDEHGKPLEGKVGIKGDRLDSGKDIEGLAKALEAAGVRLAARCVGADGGDCRPVEFRSVEQGGRRLGYLVGLGKQPATVRVELGGAPARCRSLLSGETFSGDREVAPFEFDLFEIE